MFLHIYLNFLNETGLTIEKVKVYVEKHPELKRPMYSVPHYKGTIGVAANLVRHVAERMSTELVQVDNDIHDMQFDDLQIVNNILQK